MSLGRLQGIRSIYKNQLLSYKASILYDQSWVQLIPINSPVDFLVETDKQQILRFFVKIQDLEYKKLFWKKKQRIEVFILPDLTMLL